MNIERSYFPFIAGPNGSQVQLLQLETNTRIHIPPAVPTSGDEGASEIVIVGERSAVLAAEERIKAIYEDVVRRYHYRSTCLLDFYAILRRNGPLALCKFQ